MHWIDQAVSFGRDQSEIARNMVDMKASLRGMELGTSELRLAGTEQEAAAANAYLDQRYQSASKYLKLASSGTLPAADRQQAGTIADLLNQYHSAVTDLSSAMAKGEKDVTARLPALKKMSDQLATLVDQTVNVAKQRVEAANDERRSLQNTASLVSIGLSAILVILMAGSALFGRRAIATPIESITHCMKVLAGGNLSSDVPHTKREDEIGDMARAVLVFKDNAVKVRDLNRQEAALHEQNADLQTNIAYVVSSAVAGDFTARINKRYENPDLNKFAVSVNELVTSVDRGVAETNRVVAALAQGNLTENMQGEFKGVFLDLQNNVNATMERLHAIMMEVRTAIDMINGGAGELSLASQDLSKRTEQQAASLEETAAALEEITSAVKSSTDRSSEATTMVAQTRNSTERSAEVVQSAVAAIGRIEQASGEIGNILNVIDEIAFQTNLLALNAGVEAARAGDAGKGFAVVAQEVRELAQRSATAAKDIKTLITRSRSEVQEGVKLVTETGEALTEIRTHVAMINDRVSAIATASREQSTGLAEINTAVSQMDQMTQQNAAMVEESTAATTKLADQAAHLGNLVSMFKLHETRLDSRRHQRPSHSYAA
ncbi:methyl-accepting chemotaxis protein [Oryzifoliimicrobium ureilyticus]|uniref:methyl-accepting chemotaxis protein n=1 Tax=Oryzifoliimicrobium ureilyticus TaxID=3113724 RepID=UPI0030766FFC